MTITARDPPALTVHDLPDVAGAVPLVVSLSEDPGRDRPRLTSGRRVQLDAAARTKPSLRWKAVLIMMSGLPTR
jgi:hypothetical protein